MLPQNRGKQNISTDSTEFTKVFIEKTPTEFTEFTEVLIEKNSHRFHGIHGSTYREKLPQISQNSRKYL